MTWNEYLTLSEKTLSTEFHHDEQTRNLLHAVTGVLTEIDELLDNNVGDEDIVNVEEEVGDLLWYCAIIGRELQIDYRQLIVSKKFLDPQESILKITKLSLKLLDPLKKKLFYNKPIDFENFKTIASLLMLHISDYVNFYDINIEQCFDKNIAKLKARYGDKFSSEMAINRDLQTERNILEGRS
jgi:NTP pyrophosphatase (non-canonical NTP hydrolase)